MTTARTLPRLAVPPRVGGWVWVIAMATATTIVLFVFAATMVNAHPAGQLGLDLRLYLGATHRWLDGGGFYYPWQLTGSYGVDPPPILYPPPLLLLLIPFTVLPAFLWFAIPTSIIVWAIWRHHPARWSWPLLILLFGWATGPWLIWSGNPVMWAAAALAYATVRGWSGPLVLLKPSLFPFALMGVRNRRWWVTMAVVIVAAAVFLPVWGDYIRALMNFTNDRGLGYSLPDYPLMGGVVVAWVARTRAASYSALT